jgi:hypothetical protein
VSQATVPPFKFEKNHAAFCLADFFFFDQQKQLAFLANETHPEKVHFLCHLKVPFIKQQMHI